MTINTTNSVMEPQVTDGVQTLFTFTFKIFDESDLVVTYIDPLGAETVQTLTTDYTVTGSPWPGGGTVEMVSAPATGTLSIYRSIDLTNQMDLVTGGKIPPEILEQRIDATMAAVQDMQSSVGRAIRLAKTVTSTDVELAFTVAQRASKLFGFDALGDFALNPAVDAGIPIGKQSIWIPAAAWNPRVDSPCSALTATQISIGQPDLITRDFDAASDELAQLFLALPKSWDKGTLTYRVFWTGTANANDVVWGLQGTFIADDGAIGVAYGTAVEITDTHLNVTNDLMISAESTAITLAGSPADNGLSALQFYRNANDASDTYTLDARLVGVMLHFTTNAGTDV